MAGVSKLKTIGRVMALVLLLASLMGPWFADSHPSAEEACTPPLVWLGGGYCACLISLTSLIEYLFSGLSSLWLLCVPPVLPVLSTLLLLLIGERRWLWASHLAAWGTAAVYSLFWFIGLWIVHRGAVFLWGAGLCGVTAVAVLAAEMWTARMQVNTSPQRIP